MNNLSKGVSRQVFQPQMITKYIQVPKDQSKTWKVSSCAETDWSDMRARKGAFANLLRIFSFV